MSQDPHCKREGAFAFRRDNIEARVPEKPGVYVFWSGFFCVYVGQAKNLKTRLCEHWRKSHNDDVNMWIRAIGSKLCVTYKVVDGSLAQAEQSYIDRYMPHLNKINARAK